MLSSEERPSVFLDWLFCTSYFSYEGTEVQQNLGQEEGTRRDAFLVPPLALTCHLLLIFHLLPMLDGRETHPGCDLLGTYHITSTILYTFPVMAHLILVIILWRMCSPSHFISKETEAERLTTHTLVAEPYWSLACLASQTSTAYTHLGYQQIRSHSPYTSTSRGCFLSVVVTWWLTACTYKSLTASLSEMLGVINLWVQRV
jgi:hypothetical protein